MAISYVSRKCDCGGKLEYDKNRKVWVCIYCGSEIERQEQYDGLFTIKNVVRQTLLDVAYRRLDNAEKNLTECEKIDSRYIGTILANLCYLMIKAATPGACDAAEAKSVIAKIKRYNDALRSEYETITDEEEGLYEFFDTSDIYAALVLVYDSLNDAQRRDHMMRLMKLQDVFSVDTNKNLLSYSIKNRDFALCDGIIKNSEYIDKKFALSEVLSRYPDGGKKVENIAELLSQKAFGREDRELIDNYLDSSADSYATKAKVVISAYMYDVRPGMDPILKNVLARSEDVSAVTEVLEQVCSSDLSDEDTYKIVDFCFGCQNTNTALAVLECLKKTKQYVVLDQRYMVSLLARTDIGADSKIAVLKAAYEFNVDSRAREGVINNYLCFNQDDASTRAKVIPFLLGTVKTVQTNTFEGYLLKCGIDGANKSEIVKSIFQLDVNTSYYYDLLSKYLFTAVDDAGTKEAIVGLLLDRDIKVDPKSFCQYVCSANDSGENKIRCVKKMLEKGCTLNSDTLSQYLTGMKSPGEFDPDLFALLFNEAGVITDEALEFYVLYCRDRESVKAGNAAAMAARTGKSFGSQPCRIVHNGNEIECNLLQGYILIGDDAYAVAAGIVKSMVDAKTKINAEMRIAGGRNEKLKKYVAAGRSSLSPLTERLCQEYKVFGMLF